MSDAQATAEHDMTGRRAIVTGGAGGIGAAVADALRARGAHVFIWDPAIEDGVDVTDTASVSSAADAAQADLLVCAAGVVDEHPLRELSDDAWARVVSVSLDGTFRTCRAVLPGMAARGGGSVVAFSSGYATMGYLHGGHYAAAKAGVEALVKSLAREFGGVGVRVNGIAPGPIDTPMLDHIADRDAWSAAREAAIPLGRIGTVEDIVGPTLFLLGPAAGYVTGQILHVNGGLLMP